MGKDRTPAPPGDAQDDEQDDGALFMASIDGVRPLPPVPAPPPRPKPRARARMAERDEAEAREALRRGGDEPSFLLALGDAMSFRRDDVPARVLRRLGQGTYSAQDELDLHHVDAARGEAMLKRFLGEARDAGHACVRVVHGKGLHSEGSVPVLKNIVDRVLRQRGDVLAFHSAPAAQGGTGAVLVLLAPRRGAGGPSP